MALGPGGRMETAVGGQAEEAIELAAVHGAVAAGVANRAVSAAAEAVGMDTAPPPKLSARYPPPPKLSA